MLWGPRIPRWGLMGCLLFLVLPDGDFTDTVSGPRSTASDLTSSKASTKSPTQRHNPFNEDQAETVSSSDTTPVHTTSQEKVESQALDLSDTCTELEVIRSAEGRGGLGGHPGVHLVYSQHRFLVPADWDPLEGSWASCWRLPPRPPAW